MWCRPRAREGMSCSRCTRRRHRAAAAVAQRHGAGADGHGCPPRLGGAAARGGRRIHSPGPGCRTTARCARRGLPPAADRLPEGPRRGRGAPAGRDRHVPRIRHGGGRARGNAHPGPDRSLRDREDVLRQYLEDWCGSGALRCGGRACSTSTARGGPRPHCWSQLRRAVESGAAASRCRAASSCATTCRSSTPPTISSRSPTRAASTASSTSAWACPVSVRPLVERLAARRTPGRSASTSAAIRILAHEPMAFWGDAAKLSQCGCMLKGTGSRR